MQHLTDIKLFEQGLLPKRDIWENSLDSFDTCLISNEVGDTYLSFGGLSVVKAGSIEAFVENSCPLKLTEVI